MTKIHVLLLLTALLLLPSIASAESPPAALSVEFSLTPSTDTDGAFEAAAIIRDATTSEVLSAPRILFRQGEEAASSTKLPDGREVHLTVLVHESGTKAEYSANVVESGQVQALHKATITLGT